MRSICVAVNSFYSVVPIGISTVENVANRDEFDGDSDAGVYNPVVLPWKNR